MSLVTEKEIEAFWRDGVVVIQGVLTVAEGNPVNHPRCPQVWPRKAVVRP